MYGSIGSFSGVVHLVARRPLIAAALSAAVLTLVMVAPIEAPPPAPTLPAPVVQMDVPITAPIVQESGPTLVLLDCCNFRSNSAYVDNVCKAKLDGVVLYLKAHDASVVLEGNSLSGQGSVATLRARNVKTYLVQNGIDSKRITVQRGTKHLQRVDVVTYTK